MSSLEERVEKALSEMVKGPECFLEFLRQPSKSWQKAKKGTFERVLNIICDKTLLNSEISLEFREKLCSWDNEIVPFWGKRTNPNSKERRILIHELLGIPKCFRTKIDHLISFVDETEAPITTSPDEQQWYTRTRLGDGRYWEDYKKYLRGVQKWPISSLKNLDIATDQIISFLAEPSASNARSTKGLVIGYVQSGKTSNFVGLSAKAIDVGYRLIIVLAGTWNILRYQTQRRFDKELIGKEFLVDDTYYQRDPPGDWDEFLTRSNYDPEDPRCFGLYRLTTLENDYKSLGRGLPALRFNQQFKNLPLYDRRNLRTTDAKIFIIKKQQDVLKNLIEDLKHSRLKLSDVPCLIIDDESDYASLNTSNPTKRDRDKTKINSFIVELMKMLPRSQYVGYTATPYANVFADYGDPESLFPSDFIVSLPRPLGYMGISDFLDPDINSEDLDEGDYTQNENAFIRKVKSPLGKDDCDLTKALSCFVLSGALKLFRNDKDKERYGNSLIKHHTMLIHTDFKKESHEDLALRISDLWDKAGFSHPNAKEYFAELWKNDFHPVSMIHGLDEVLPSQFDCLDPFLGESIERISKGLKTVVVNSDHKNIPDFSSDEAVWKIFIGGNKLSRGYTIAGLTVSYYRRSASAGDILMQMGRWFGFRKGYKDLVRVFLGVCEGRKGDVNLVEEFKYVCRMEEKLREDIKRYASCPEKDGLRPKHFPPMIYASLGQKPPTARNKMYFAKLKGINMGGKRWNPVTFAKNIKDIKSNFRAFDDLTLLFKEPRKVKLRHYKNSKQKGMSEFFVGDVTHIEFLKFIRNFKWIDGIKSYLHYIEFLKNEENGITNWVIMTPIKIKASMGEPITLTNGVSFNVKKRARLGARGSFGVIGEPAHRPYADYIASTEHSFRDPELEFCSGTDKLKAPRTACGLFYLVRDEVETEVSVTFELFFPPNKIPYHQTFTQE